MNVPAPKYQIIYNGKDITKNILEFVTRFVYTDKSQGEADEIEISVEDSQRNWQNEWYPVKGDSVAVKIFDSEGTLDCGTFTIDEITGEGSKDGGDSFKIKGIAAGINKAIRTKKGYAHESKTIREIVNTVAAKHGFRVEGEIKDVRIGRVTQYRETDLQFLQRVSNDYGYIFSIRDKKLIFTNIFDIEKKKSSFTIHRKEIVSWQITDKTSNTFKGVKNSYHNPRRKAVISFQETESEPSYQNSKADILKVNIKAENEQQSELKSKVALYRANSAQQQGTIDIVGNVLAVAGNNCEIQGLGQFSGNYYLETSTHTVEKEAGYTTQISIKRVGLVGKNKQKTDKKV